MAPVKKVRFSENLIDTKKAGPLMNEIKNRTQIQYELPQGSSLQGLFCP